MYLSLVCRFYRFQLPRIHLMFYLIRYVTFGNTIKVTSLGLPYGYNFKVRAFGLYRVPDSYDGQHKILSLFFGRVISLL